VKDEKKWIEFRGSKSQVKELKGINILWQLIAVEKKLIGLMQ
jgi:hypothetical protein